MWEKVWGGIIGFQKFAWVNEPDQVHLLLHSAEKKRVGFQVGKYKDNRFT